MARAVVGVSAAKEVEPIKPDKDSAPLPPHLYVKHFMTDGDKNDVGDCVKKAHTRYIEIRLDMLVAFPEALAHVDPEDSHLKLSGSSVYTVGGMNREEVDAAQDADRAAPDDEDDEDGKGVVRARRNSVGMVGAGDTHKDPRKDLFILVEELCVLMLVLGYYVSAPKDKIHTDDRELCKIAYLDGMRHKLDLLASDEIQPLVAYAKKAYGLMAF